MKNLLVVGMVLVMSTALWAQGDNPDACVYCNCLTDATCTATVCNSALSSDCVSRTLSVTCPGTYYLYINLDCTNGQYCEHCCAQTFITGPGVDVMCHGACSANNCKYACGTVTLEANVNYTWSTCLRVCPDQTCGDCITGSCVARAWLKKNETDACPWPCN